MPGRLHPTPRLQRWVFPTLRAWTNVAARRGYLLDGLADWLANRGAREGDCLALSRTSDAAPPVSASSSILRQPACCSSPCLALTFPTFLGSA